jgi:hypothetical protein
LKIQDMRPTAAGIYPNFVQPNAPPPGEVPATSSYVEGGDLVATVTRTKDDAVSRRAAAAYANVNKASDFSANLAEAQSSAYTPSSSSARFLKPDSLLSKMEKAKVDHLRTREEAIKKETDQLKPADAAGLSFVYETGPDGRNYIVGVATPLVLQTQMETNDKPPALLEKEQDRGYAAYGLRAGTSSRAGFLNDAY